MDFAPVGEGDTTAQSVPSRVASETHSPSVLSALSTTNMQAAAPNATQIPTTPSSLAATPATPQIREELVKSACDFLTHPRVIGSDNERKRAFLQSKGLTNEEIAEAMRRVGATTQATTSLQPYNTGQHARATPYATTLPPPPPPPQPLMLHHGHMQPVVQSPSIRALVMIAFICSGVATTVVYLVKKYIISYFWPDKKQKQLEQLQECLETVRHQVAQQAAEVKEALGVIRTFLESQVESYQDRQQLDEMRARQEMARVSELKRDIEAVKNLLPIGSSLLAKSRSSNGLNSEFLEEFPEIKDSITSLKKSVSASRNALSASAAVPLVQPIAEGAPVPSPKVEGRTGPKKALPEWMATPPTIPAWQQQTQTSNTTTITPTDSNAEANSSAASSGSEASSEPTPTIPAAATEVTEATETN